MHDFFKVKKRDINVEESFGGVLLKPRRTPNYFQVTVVLVPTKTSSTTPGMYNNTFKERGDMELKEEDEKEASESVASDSSTSTPTSNSFNSQNLSAIRSSPSQYSSFNSDKRRDVIQSVRSNNYLNNGKCSPRHKRDIINNTSTNIFQINVQTKMLSSIRAFLHQLTQSLSCLTAGISRHFPNPFNMLLTLEGRPVRTVVELVRVRTAIATHIPLNKRELLTITKIIHRVPFLVPNAPQQVAVAYGYAKLRKETPSFIFENSCIDIVNSEASDGSSTDVLITKSTMDLESDKAEGATNIIIDEVKFINKNWKEEFNIHEEIGRGNFATVFRYEKGGKVIKGTHENLILFYGAFYDCNDGVGILTSYCDSGDLFTFVSSKIKHPESDSEDVDFDLFVPCLDEFEAAGIFKQILEALNYLHDLHIVHRDIKPENILICNCGNQGFPQIKICDFGLAVQIDVNAVPDEFSAVTGVCGTPYYIAPEMLLQSGYGVMIDVWAAGIVLFVLLAGYPPFYSKVDDNNEIFEKILECDIDLTQPGISHTSAYLQVLIYCLLTFDPQLRSSAKDALKSKWFEILENPPTTE